MNIKRITLAVAHQHKGISYQKGDEIKVNEADAAWLVEREIGLETVYKQDVLDVTTGNANNVNNANSKKK